jgi:hypothetical protein
MREDPSERAALKLVRETDAGLVIRGKIGMHVRDDRGNAVLDATVLVFVDDETQWRFQSRFIRTARPDTSGRYEITGLPASADYRVLAVQGMEEGQATDPEFLASLRDRAERLSLNDGEIKTLDVRLRP